MIYEEGKLAKYRLLDSLNFDPYFKYAALDYLYMMHKIMDIFDKKFSNSTFCNFTCSWLSDLLLHIMYCYGDVSYRA